MANYLIKPIGGVDLEIEDKSKFKELSYYSETGKTIRAVRINGKKLLKQINEDKSLINYISFKIIEGGIKFCEQKFNGEPFTLLFIVTDNKKDNKDDDSLYFGKIFKIWQRQKYRLQFITLEEDLKTFDANYNELSEYFNNEKAKIKFNFSDDKVVVHTAAGLPNTRIALMLHCIQSFKESNVCQLETFVESEGLVTIEQSFPKQFRDNLRKNIFPHALKETLAIISAKNLSHTDGSHVMPWFENALIKGEYNSDINEAFSEYNTYLKNTMELTADLSGGMGNQSFFNYLFIDIAVCLKSLFTTFLGKGVTDGKGEAKIEIDNELKTKIVALPGGENGKTALVVILKNFFRNLYKHSGADDKNNYSGMLKLEEYDSDEFLKISLTEESKSYSKKDADTTVKKINDLINKKILNEDLTIRETGWGIMEMKIAAAYLIGLPLELFESFSEVGRGNFPSPFIEASEKVNSDGLYKIKYTFYLLKTKIALIEKNEDWHYNEITLPQGFDWLDETDKKKEKKRHEFLIRKANSTQVSKLKSSNIKQVFLDSSETILDYLEEKEENIIHNKWLESFHKGMSDSQEIQLRAYNRLSECPIELKNLCVIDDHGKWYLSKNTYPDLTKLFYYEKLNNPDNKLTRFIKTDEYKKPYIINTIKDRLIESILTNVAVLDERVQEYSETTKDKELANFKLHTLYGLKRIFIPLRLTSSNQEDIAFDKWEIDDFSGKKCSLNELMYGKEKNSTASKFEFLVKLLEYYFVQKNCHYVVLHLSGFETIVNDSSKYLKSKISGYTGAALDEAFWYLLGPKVLGKYIKDKSKYLVLTSGKGTPKTLPHNSYFVSLGNLEFALKRNKYELVKLLNSIRKIKK